MGAEGVESLEVVAEGISGAGATTTGGGGDGITQGDGGGDGVDKRIGALDGISVAEVGGIGSSVCKERSTPTWMAIDSTRVTMECISVAMVYN